MSEKKTVSEKKTPDKKAPESKGTKFINWWKRLPSRIATPFKNMWRELKRVTWPTKRKLIVYSVVVIVFMVVMSIVIGLLDTGASALIRLLV